LKGYKVVEGDELVEVVVEVNGKFLDPVTLQVRQPAIAGQPGFIFAPFAANASYHGGSLEHWNTAAEGAIVRYLGQAGMALQGKTHPEPAHPLNVMAEFR
jgi:hypothetical protein